MNEEAYEEVEVNVELPKDYKHLYESEDLREYLRLIYEREVLDYARNLTYYPSFFSSEDYIYHFIDGEASSAVDNSRSYWYNIGLLISSVYSNGVKRTISKYSNDYMKSCRHFQDNDFYSSVSRIPINPYTFHKFFLDSLVSEFDISFVLEAICAYKQTDPLEIISSHFDTTEISFITGFRDLHFYCLFVRSVQTIYCISYGTKDIIDVATDANLKQVEFLNSYVHNGFYKQAKAIYMRMKDPLLDLINFHNNTYRDNQPLRIVFGGHSMGGSVSQLLYLIFKSKFPRNNYFCITFGAPFCVSKHIANAINDPREIINFINGKDPVPFSSRLGKNAFTKLFSLFEFYNMKDYDIPTIIASTISFVSADFLYFPIGFTYIIDSIRHTFVPVDKNRDGVLDIPSSDQVNIKRIKDHLHKNYTRNFYNILVNCI